MDSSALLKADPMRAAEQCGAKTRSNTPCKRRPAPGNKRCRLHGGSSTGPRTRGGKKRSAHPTHGIYATALGVEEVTAVEQRGITLVQELTVARVQLRRALLAWEKWNTTNPKGLPADEHVTTQNDRGEGTTIRRRRPDLWGIIDRCLGRIGRLAEQHAKVEEVKEIERRLDELTEKLENQ